MSQHICAKWVSATDKEIQAFWTKTQKNKKEGINIVEGSEKEGALVLDLDSATTLDKLVYWPELSFIYG